MKENKPEQDSVSSCAAYQAPLPKEGGGGCADGGEYAEYAATDNCVCECNRAYNAETLHPLVSLIDTSAPCSGGSVSTDCYAVVFMRGVADGAEYGRKYYDFTDTTVLFLAPRRDIDLRTADGKMLIFHPDLVRCTPLGMALGDCSFFNYRRDEALHLSACEWRVVKRCLGCVGDELGWGVDAHSKAIICTIIELLLNYCRRFYARQFITRHDANIEAIAALDAIIDGAFASGRVASGGLPTASAMAPRLGMSAGYLDDMLRSETGNGVDDYVRLRRMRLAKRMLIAGDKPVSEISRILGFCSEKCFAAVFKKVTGVSPEEYV